MGCHEELSVAVARTSIIREGNQVLVLNLVGHPRTRAVLELLAEVEALGPVLEPGVGEVHGAVDRHHWRRLVLAVHG